MWIVRVFVKDQDRYLGEEEEFRFYADAAVRAKEILKEGGPVYVNDEFCTFVPPSTIVEIDVFKEEGDAIETNPDS